MKRMIYTYFPLIFFISLSSCSDDYKSSNKELIFIGDSIIRGWNTDKYFNSEEYNTTNYGVNGSRLDDLPERHEGLLANKNIVIIIGTNDVFSLNSEASLEFYTQKYVAILECFKAKQIYLFSILPRNYNNSEPPINERIIKLNKSIQKATTSVPNITYIDAYNEFLDDGTTNMTLFIDGLHPNQLGYEILTRLLKENIQR